MNKSSGTIYHASPEGESLKDETNNKSSGTIYHASPEGESLKDETNNKSSGTCSGAWMHRSRTKGWNYHASPEGFYMDVDGRATHMYMYGRTDICSCNICTSTIRGGRIRVTQGAVTEEQLPR